MKKALFATLVIFVFASCGGGGSGPTPTPTSDGTKATTQAVSDEVMPAAGEGTLNGLNNMAPSAMVVKGAAEKTSYCGNISTTYNCNNGGSIGVTGNITASCDQSTPDSPWSCTSISSTMDLTFTDCARQVTVGSTTYNVIMNGTGTATMSGTASGSADSIDSAHFLGTLSGIPMITGDLTGTVNLANLTFTGEITGDAEPEITCSGTVLVILGTVEQICGITADCSSCTE